MLDRLNRAPQKTPYIRIGISAEWFASMIRYQWYNAESEVDLVPLPENASDLKQGTLDKLVVSLERAKERVLAWTEDDLTRDD